MKQTALSALILFLSAILYSSCQEEVYTDWKNKNDRFYASLEDTVARYDTLTYIDNSLSGADKYVHFPLKKTATGIYYQVIKQGDGRFPNPGDMVNITYTGTLVDKSVFDTATAVNNYTTNYVSGMQEILSKMQNKAHYIVYLPYKMAYDSVKQGAIPPYSVLKFDLTLNSSY